MNLEILLIITSVMLQSTWYINSTSSGAIAHSYSTLAATSANIRIGRGYAGYWQGSMAFVAAYNRALTAAEVTRNFNAIRSRYGI